MEKDDDGDDVTEEQQWSATAAPASRVRMSGDEREQVVLLEATVRGSRLLVDGLLVLMLVTALFGNWLLPAALLVILALSGRLADDYAHERQVSAAELARGRRRRQLLRPRPLLVLLALLLTFAAMSYTGYTGTGVLPAPDVVATGPEAGALLRTGAWSLPLWAALGMVVLAVGGAARRRRAAGRRSSE